VVLFRGTDAARRCAEVDVVDDDVEQIKTDEWRGFDAEAEPSIRDPIHRTEAPLLGRLRVMNSRMKPNQCRSHPVSFQLDQGEM
jgi:hypothetical protein